MRNVDINEGTDYARKGPGAQIPDRVRVVHKGINARRVYIKHVYSDGKLGVAFAVPTSQILKPWAAYDNEGA